MMTMTITMMIIFNQIKLQFVNVTPGDYYLIPFMEEKTWGAINQNHVKGIFDSSYQAKLQ